MWFEAKTNRIRARYRVGSDRFTTSESIERESLRGAFLICLRWLWKQHFDATKAACPYRLA